MSTARLRECEQAVGVAALVATTLGALPRAWQLPAGILLAALTLAVTLGVSQRRTDGI